MDSSSIFAAHIFIKLHVSVINGFNLDTAGGEKLLFVRKLMTSLILNGSEA